MAVVVLKICPHKTVNHVFFIRNPRTLSSREFNLNLTETLTHERALVPINYTVRQFELPCFRKLEAADEWKGVASLESVDMCTCVKKIS